VTPAAIQAGMTMGRRCGYQPSARARRAEDVIMGRAKTVVAEAELMSGPVRARWSGGTWEMYSRTFPQHTEDARVATPPTAGQRTGPANGRPPLSGAGLARDLRDFLGGGGGRGEPGGGGEGGLGGGGSFSPPTPLFGAGPGGGGVGGGLAGAALGSGTDNTGKDQADQAVSRREGEGVPCSRRRRGQGRPTTGPEGAAES